jgi:hypothetical protein
MTEKGEKKDCEKLEKKGKKIRVDQSCFGQANVKILAIVY